MKVKNDRLEALRMIISSQELGSQDELLDALKKEGFQLTQATLSRDLKQLKVAKAASMRGNYVYVLPNDTMYKRVTLPHTAREMMQVPGFLSINFSGNMGVIKTRPGYASSIAYNRKMQTFGLNLIHLSTFSPKVCIICIFSYISLIISRLYNKSFLQTFGLNPRK